jgi:hypothetical protein
LSSINEVESVRRDLPDLAHPLDLEQVAHYTTLPKATQRLLTLPAANQLLTATVRRVLGRRPTVALAAFDSTGLQCGRASSCFVRRRARGKSQWQTTTYKRFAKLAAVWLCSTAKTLRATAHVVRRHSGRIESVVALEIDVPRSWLRRSKKGLWYCPNDIRPDRIRGVVTFGELSRSPVEEAAGC